MGQSRAGRSWEGLESCLEFKSRQNVFKPWKRKQFIISRSTKKKVDIDNWFRRSEKTVFISYSGPYSVPETITINGKLPYSLLVRVHLEKTKAQAQVKLNYFQPNNIPKYKWIMKGNEFRNYFTFRNLSLLIDPEYDCALSYCRYPKVIRSKFIS